MNKHSDAAEIRRAVQSLTALALDVRWSWSHVTDEVWRALDAELWARTHNPWVVLRTVSRRRLEALLGEPVLRAKVLQLAAEAGSDAAAPAWFQLTHNASALKRVGYFSMEFMLCEALPIYAGGLGNVAGDQLKAASDLGVPVVAVGLLYQRGYFRQIIDRSGAQQALYPYNDPDQLPVTPLRRPDGEWLRVELEFPGGILWLRTWQVQVGRLKLYLLDSNDAANHPAYRGITSELYGGGPELRLQQEIVLGIGGWRLLTALGEEPDVCHLNEGHAAFAVLERASSYMRATGRSFEEALATTRAGNLFTTHTAVAAGFDLFARPLIEQYLTAYARERLGVGLSDLLALGRRDEQDQSEPFNVAYLAFRGSAAVNAVSRLHQEVSQEIFAPLFPRWPLTEVPVRHVTNGVHVPSWDSPESDRLWTQACGKNRWRGDLRALSDEIRASPDGALWVMRGTGREALVEYVRERLKWQLSATTGMDATAAPEAVHVLHPDALTLGFARRFAAYKRPNLLLSDPERLVRLLTNPARPVQLIIAGKAHPADQIGQEMIREWVRFIRRPDVRAHAVFLADYDVLLTERLVRGVDVWINTPRRPWEACGTSGMKVLVNGGINVSELDGWWAEAYAPGLGWALGDGQSHGEDGAWDAPEANCLYDLLEQEVVPQFYARDAQGIPRAWVQRVRDSMAELTPRSPPIAACANMSSGTIYRLPPLTRLARRNGVRVVHVSARG
jgi:starch phosphorylase